MHRGQFCAFSGQDSDDAMKFRCEIIGQGRTDTILFEFENHSVVYGLESLFCLIRLKMT